MTNKIEQLIEKYQKNYKEMRLEIPTGEIIKDLQSLQDTTEERKKKDQLCYRCWMSKKDLKKDYCGCSARWKYYGKHLWKIDYSFIK